MLRKKRRARLDPFRAILFLMKGSHQIEKDLSGVKQQILLALKHPEAEEGLYFRNFSDLHEEDERPAVKAEQVLILDALKQLIDEGQVIADESGKEVVFSIKS